jgi:hypothetical protein
LNSPSSFLSLPSAGIVNMSYHTQLPTYTLYDWLLCNLIVGFTFLLIFLALTGKAFLLCLPSLGTKWPRHQMVEKIKDKHVRATIGLGTTNL